MNIAVRTTVAPEQLVAQLRKAVLNVDPLQPAHSVVPLEELLDASVARDRFAMILMGGFAIVALLLAVGGCYLVVGGADLDLLHQNRLGVGVGLISAAGFASYSLLSEKGMHRHSPWTVLFYAIVVAGVILLVATVLISLGE